ncbi:BZIP domain-containing protein [Fusarium sp. LHS14.1]|nr:BZIP domain-containing protein [Fusarium sp. LHS14.1]
MEYRDVINWTARDKPTESVGRTPGADPPSKRRVLTEARREQNRLAQRAYRQRQKEHRKQLKEAESRRYQARRPRPLLKRCDITSKPTKSSHDTQGSVNEPLKDEILSTQGTPHSHVNTHDGTISSSPDEAGDSTLPSYDALIEIDTDQIGEDTHKSSEVHGDDLQLIPTRHRPDKSFCSQQETNKPQDELVLPDMYLNMLRFEQVTISHAVFQNALSMGLDLQFIANCGAHCISPFYQPSLASTTDATALLQQGAASTASFKNTSIPIHLRPTLAQVLIPHHASLDLIPIPFLRERAIMLSAAMPNTFNSWELKFDIYGRGGLTIWRRNQSGTERRSNTTYQPWDMKSWEAAPWFLKKWTMIIGDEESEFYKQSIGWQLVRDLILSQGDLQLGNGDT